MSSSRWVEFVTTGMVIKMKRNCHSAHNRLKHNGPAVEGVNVGGAVRRYESWYFSQKIVPAGKPPWRNFCQSRRTIKLSWLKDLSRAGINLADVWKVLSHDKTVKVARKNCDKFITPTVRVRRRSIFKTVMSAEI